MLVFHKTVFIVIIPSLRPWKIGRWWFMHIIDLQAATIPPPLYTCAPVCCDGKILHDLSRSQNQLLESFQKSTLIVHYMWCTIRWLRITLLNFVFCEKNHNVIYFIYYEQARIFNKIGRNNFCETSKNIWEYMRHKIRWIFKELWVVLRVIGKIRERLIRIIREIRIKDKFC